MNSKERNKEIEQLVTHLLIYFIISIPMAYLLHKVIVLKYTIIFWSFFGVMGLSALVSDYHWGMPYEQETRFLRISGHTAFVTFTTLMTWYFFFASSK